MSRFGDESNKKDSNKRRSFAMKEKYNFSFFPFFSSPYSPSQGFSTFSSTFASALLEHARKVFLRLVHSPAVMRLMLERRGAVNEIETTAYQLNQLEDVVLLLHSITNKQEGTGVTAHVSPSIHNLLAKISTSNTDVHLSIEDELLCWLQLLLWTRYLAVFLMRRLAAIHDHISSYLLYWSWAEIHYTQSSFHVALSYRWGWWWWRGLFLRGWAGQKQLLHSNIITHKSLLIRYRRVVVRSLGALYGLVDRMNALVASIADMAADVYVSNAEVETPVSRPALGSPLTDHQMLEERLLRHIRAVVASSVSQLSNTVRLPTVSISDFSFSGPSAGDVPFLFSHTGESLLFDAAPKPAGESISNLQTFTNATLANTLQVLTDTAEFARNHMTSLQESIQTNHIPPSPIRWRRLLLTSCTVLPALMWMCGKSTAELRRTALAAHAVLRGLWENYVVVPVREIRHSLFGGRPGVVERRRTLEMEMASVANIIRDYHEDYYPNSSEAELRELRENTFAHLRTGVVADDAGYALINRHYETALRHPFRSAIFGNLLRLMLIQLTYQQLEVMRVVNGTDEVLEGNDLNFKFMAMVPVCVLFGVVMLAALQKRRAKLRPVNHQLRMYWRAVHRVVTIPMETMEELYQIPSAAAADVAVGDTAGDVPLNVSKHPEGVIALETHSATKLNSYDQGMLLLLTHHMRRLAMEYHTGYHHLQEFLEDLDDLESVHCTRQQRLLTLDRMQRIHRFLS
ncbi:Nuclear control of ATP synthase 2 [Trypanosoma melophagium]|uniref:Nuclear control of ATP synthase 2 n=1 Tax=Trypanosoma melophagium TaxID=715481 RepID=UPI00351A6C1F|nr:Nuclear control of ATP synthase 2 [Trypanosoma melophagium]